MIKAQQFVIQCPQCGNEEFHIPHDAQDEDVVKCGFCNFEIVLAELREVGLEQARKVLLPEAKIALDNMLKSALKGWKK
ncbi:hypothetical protein [Pseudomonas orientalis]|uniref:hypothetical protein n=1 Tax=Pseudomonas orientalis TaxID=76758 RepID=UPI0030D99A36